VSNGKKYTLGIYEKALPSTLSWVEKLSFAKEVGYDFLEISIDETDAKLARLDYTDEEKDVFVSAMKETGLPIRSLCLSGHRKYPLGSHDPQIVEKSLEIMRKTLDFADYLGIRIIMLAGYDVYYEDSDEGTRERFEKNLVTCTRMAAQYGITLAFETMETPFMNTCAKAMKHVHAVNNAFLQVYPDLGNISNAATDAHSDVLSDLSSCKGHIVAMHLKETVPGKYRDMMYGDGDVQFQPAIDLAWSMGVRRFVTEFWYLGNKDWKKDVQFAYNFNAKLLEKED